MARTAGYDARRRVAEAWTVVWSERRERMGEGGVRARERVRRGTGTKIFQAFSMAEDFQRLNKKKLSSIILFSEAGVGRRK
jgi:hypothetical protein